jgi:hypothetical protein
MRRFGSVLLAIIAGMLFPVLIWVALFLAIREPLLVAAKRFGSVVLALLAGMLAPVLIWVGCTVTIRELLHRRRESRLPYGMVCSTDNDCPPGYICVAGRCVHT